MKIFWGLTILLLVWGQSCLCQRQIENQKIQGIHEYYRSKHVANNPQLRKAAMGNRLERNKLEKMYDGHMKQKFLANPSDTVAEEKPYRAIFTKPDQINTQLIDSFETVKKTLLEATHIGFNSEDHEVYETRQELNCINGQRCARTGKFIFSNTPVVHKEKTRFTLKNNLVHHYVTRDANFHRNKGMGRRNSKQRSSSPTRRKPTSNKQKSGQKSQKTSSRPARRPPGA